MINYTDLRNHIKGPQPAKALPCIWDFFPGFAEAISDHVCSQVMPEQLAEFILPFEQAIFAEFSNAIKIYHNEVFHADEHVNLILKFGADIWHFGSDVHHIDELYSLVNDDIVLFGGLNPHGVMAYGSPEEVRFETIKVLEAAKNHRFLLSTGTGTTPETTLENQLAMVQTVKNF